MVYYAPNTNSSDNPAIEKICRGEDDFPTALERLNDAPPHLYVRGRIPALPLVAIVGSRAADTMTRRFARSLAKDLTGSGFGIASGGARGIDTAAHEGALAAGGTTVAVLGTGFAFTYPEENADLFQQIAERGALVTELEQNQPPARWTFPKRNRIIAGLSQAVIVVGAAERSGALITARIAKEAGIPLGAVPGTAGDPHHQGSNALLRNGALMIESVEDVLALLGRRVEPKELELPGIAAKPPHFKEIGGLSHQELKILDILSSRPIHIDEIIAGTGLGTGETGAAILSLEIAGLVEDQGGRNFVRVC